MTLEANLQRTNESLRISSDIKGANWKIDSYVNSFKNFFHKNAYILTVFSMMIYGIVYHSWIGFTFLLASNIIWLFPHERSNCIKLSPFIVAYASLILIINYIYDIKFQEIDPESHKIFQQVGIKYIDLYPFIHLTLKVALIVPYWTLMFQKFRITFFDIQAKTEETAKWIKMLKKCFVFLWMWLTIIFLFLIAMLRDEMNLLRIVNVALVLIFVIAFQLSFKFWAKMMRKFCLILITYATVLLIAIYVHQFSFSQDLEIFKMIGLYKMHTSELFVKLLSLTVLSIMCKIQLHYFHPDFIKLFNNSNDSNVMDESDELNEGRIGKLLKKLEEILEKVLLIVEIHFHKAVFIFMFLSSCGEVR